MARLHGHATDAPGRWKEPRALAATDHASRRTRQGRGRHHVRRRVGGQCVEATARSGKCDPSRGRDRRAGDRDDRGGLLGWRDGAGARRAATAGGSRCGTRPSNTRDRDHRTGRSQRGGCSADRFSGEAGVSTALEQRRSAPTGRHRPNRGTTDTTAAACWSPRSSRGPGGSVRVLTLSPLSLRQLAHRPTPINTVGAWTPAPRPRWPPRPDDQEDKIKTPDVVTSCVQNYALLRDRRQLMRAHHWRRLARRSRAIIRRSERRRAEVGPAQSPAAALLVFLTAAARAGLIAADFCRRAVRFVDLHSIAAKTVSVVIVLG